uniref:Uncharacterized protein n=1 Tax=Glossina pallidipes TaxID=7398 RepID=A0A1A9ZFI9_GLOPL
MGHVVVGPCSPRRRPKSDYDFDVFRQELREGSHLYRLKIEWFFKLLNQRLRFGYLKFFAVERVEIIFRQQLSILNKTNKCNLNEKEPDEELTHGIFSWSLDKFVERRTLRNFIFIEVLKKFSENCLDNYKFRCDLKELLELVKLVFDGLYSEMSDQSLDIETHTEKPILDARELLKKQQNIESEYKRNKSIFTQLFNAQLLMSQRQHRQSHVALKTNLQTKILYSHLWDPIERRYQLNWYRTKLHQSQLRMDSMQNYFNSSISKFMSQTVDEERCSSSCMDFFYTMNEKLKRNIQRMQANYDADYEVAENKLNLKRMQIEKLKDQQRYQREQILRFHEEIEAMRIRELKAQERKEREEAEKLKVSLNSIEDKTLQLCNK